MGRILLLCLLVIFSFSMSIQGQPLNAQMFIDSPLENDTVSENFSVIGWAFDQNAGEQNGPGVDQIYIYQGTQCSGELIGQGGLTEQRSDVAERFNLDNSYDLSGYSIPVETNSIGPFSFTVCAINDLTDDATSQVTRTIDIVPAEIRLEIDGLWEDGPILDNTAISGWAIDSRAGASSGPGINYVEVIRGNDCQGEAVGQSDLTTLRRDESNNLNLDSSYSRSGFSFLVDNLPISTDTLTFCAYSSVDSSVISKSINISVVKSDSLPLWFFIFNVIVTFSAFFLLVSYKNRQLVSDTIWSRFWFRFLYIAISLIPSIIILTYIRRYAVNVPYWDEWNLSVRTYLDSVTGQLDFSSLWQLQNEHRSFVPKIIALIIAHLTSLSMLALIFFNFLLSTILWVLIYSLYRHTSESEKNYFMLFPTGALLFTMVIWPRWMDTRPMYLLSAILTFMGSLWIIITGKRGWRTLLIAGVFASLSSLSFFTGNYTWFAVGGVMIFVGYFNIRYLIAWGLMAAIVLIPYVIDFTNSDTIARNAASPTLNQLTKFTLIFIGSPLVPPPVGGSQNEALQLGVIGLGTASLLGLYNLFIINKGFYKSLPWLAIIGWIILNAATAGYGRIAEFGIATARSHRYMIYGILFWISITALISIPLIEPKQSTLANWKSRIYRFRYILHVSLIGIMLFIGFNYINAYRLTVEDDSFSRRALQLRSGYGCLFDYMEAPDSCLENVFYSSSQLRFIAYQLSQRHVNFLDIDTYPLPVQYSTNVQRPEIDSMSINNEDYDVFIQTSDDISWEIYIPNNIGTMLSTAIVLPEPQNKELQYHISVTSEGETPIELDLQETIEDIPEATLQKIEADLTPFAGKQIIITFSVSHPDQNEITWLIPEIAYH